MAYSGGDLQRRWRSKPANREKLRAYQREYYHRVRKVWMSPEEREAKRLAMIEYRKKKVMEDPEYWTKEAAKRAKRKLKSKLDKFEQEYL